MKKIFKSALVILVGVMILALASCSGANNSNSTQNKTEPEKQTKELKVYNWGDYIDETVIKDFEAKTGIKIVYDTFDTNETMYAKVKADLSSYDVVFPSDYMIKQMSDEGMLAEINLDNVPNHKLIDKMFKSQLHDPQNKFSLPYMWGTVGLVYNKEMVKEKVDSWGILWDKKYSKKILMLDSHRDSIGVALKLLGYSLNTTNKDELDKAKAKLIEQKPLVLAYVVDEMKDKMIGDEAAIALCWSGDAIKLVTDFPDKFDYVIPKEGSNWWIDGMSILKGSKNKKAAEQFIDYMCSTDVAVKNCNEIRYSTPQIEAKEKMKELDKDYVEKSMAYPSIEVMTKPEIFINPKEASKYYAEIWQEIKSK